MGLNAGGWRRWMIAAIGLVLAAGGWWAWLDQAPEAPPGRAGSGAAGEASVVPADLPTPVLAKVRAGAPTDVVIPTLGVEAPVVGVEAPGRTLTPPADAGVLGWWADGARPGARRGSVLVAGHTVTGGAGALNRLEELAPGDLIDVRTQRGVVGYTVRRVRTFSKGTLARRAAELFSQQVPGRLVLVTCEDWDGSRYLSNVVVLAEPR